MFQYTKEKHGKKKVSGCNYELQSIEERDSYALRVMRSKNGRILLG